MESVILNVRPDEYTAIRKLIDQCHRTTCPIEGNLMTWFDEKLWIDGMAEIIGAAVTMDLMLNSSPDKPITLQVVWSESEWTKPRLQGGDFFVSNIGGFNPRGKDAMRRYAEGSTMTYS